MDKFKLAKQKAILIYGDFFDKELHPRYSTFGDKFHFFLFKLSEKYYQKCYLYKTVILNHWYVNYYDERYDLYATSHVAYMLKYNEKLGKIECITKIFNFSRF